MILNPSFARLLMEIAVWPRTAAYNCGSEPYVKSQTS